MAADSATVKLTRRQAEVLLGALEAAELNPLRMATRLQILSSQSNLADERGRRPVTLRLASLEYLTQVAGETRTIDSRLVQKLEAAVKVAGKNRLTRGRGSRPSTDAQRDRRVRHVTGS